MSENSKFYDIQQASEILGVSEKEILNMISSKKIPAALEDEVLKIKVEDLEDFLSGIYKEDNGKEDITVDKDDSIREDGGKEKREFEVLISGKKALLEKAYKELLQKKQELEEDINYLQYEYDDFKSRIKRLIIEELNMFLRKIEKENLSESDEVLQGNFERDLNIDKRAGEIPEGKTGGFKDSKDTLIFGNNDRDDEKIELSGESD